MLYKFYYLKHLSVKQQQLVSIIMYISVYYVQDDQNFTLKN